MERKRIEKWLGMISRSFLYCSDSVTVNSEEKSCQKCHEWDRGNRTNRCKRKNFGSVLIVFVKLDRHHRQSCAGWACRCDQRCICDIVFGPERSQKQKNRIWNEDLL